MTTMSPELRARVLSEAARTTSPTRAEHGRRQTTLALIAALALLALFFGMGGAKVGEKPIALVAFTAGFAVLTAAILRHLSLGRPRSMLGRPATTLLVASLAAAPLLSLSVLAAAIVWPDPAREAVVSRTDWVCGAMTLIQALLPASFMIASRRGSDPVHPAISGASMGAAAAALATALAYVRCPHGETFHCIVAHVAPLAILALLGAALGRAWLRVK
jgi:hypothetical protein